MAVMTYKLGSTGAVVKQIQRVLKVYPDGRFGKLTQEALMAWQREHGLTADGVAGPRTLAAMGISAMTQQTQQNASSIDSVFSCGVTLKKSKRRIDYIAVHCTASKEGEPMTVEQIRSIHRKNGWSDIGYHYCVYLDGSVHIGRDVHLSGAHVSGYNPYSIGVVYVGGLENRSGVPYNKLRAKDTRTPAQKRALATLLTDLRKLYPKAVIQGHRDFSPDRNHNGIIEPSEWIKDCPSFDAKTEYSNI